MPQASLKDIYLHRPLVKLAEHWSAAEAAATPAEPRNILPVNKRAHLLCGIAQTVCLLFIYGFFAMQIFLPYLGYYYLFDRLTDTPYYEAHQGLAYAYSIGAAFALFAVMPGGLFGAYHSGQVAGDWEDEGRRLSALGQLLLPLVARKIF